MRQRALILMLVAAASPMLRAQHEPVRISVSVMDPRGRHVSGLTAKDFELHDDGSLQKLLTVETRRPGPRRLAILLDEFHVEAADGARVRDAVDRFVRENLRADDRLVVLKPLDSLPSIRLTGDRDTIRDAILRFEGRKGNYEPRTPLEDEAIGRSPALAEAARAQIVLSGLRALAAKLDGSAGRSALVLISEGFVQNPRVMPARVLPDLGVVERFANRYDVPVYAFDPREVSTSETEAPESVTLRTLTTQTGGTMQAGGDLPSGLAQAARDLDSGYVLSYQPAHGDDGKFHEIQVTTTRRDAAVRVRRGYVAPPSAEMRRAFKSTITAMDEHARMLRRSPLIDVWCGVARAATAESGGRVLVTWAPGRGISGVGPSAAARVTLKATTTAGTVLFDGTLAPLRGAGMGAVAPDRAEFDAPAGRVQLTMTILGIRGNQLDLDARDLDVPSAGAPGTLLLPPLVLATRSAREFRELSEDADAAPQPSREFSRTERLLIRVPAYSGAGTETPRVTARLLNRLGQPMRDIEAIPSRGAGGPTQFDLPLAPLAPGEYYILLTATGASGTAEQRVGFRVTG